jgi:hypothetical protein
VQQFEAGKLSMHLASSASAETRKGDRAGHGSILLDEQLLLEERQTSSITYGMASMASEDRCPKKWNVSKSSDCSLVKDGCKHGTLTLPD